MSNIIMPYNTNKNSNTPLVNTIWPNTSTNVASPISPMKSISFHNELDNNIQELLSKMNTPSQASLDNGTQITEKQALAFDDLQARKELANKYIALKQDELSFNKGVGITTGVLQGLGSTVNAGLGIWGAIESAKNAKKSRELMDKQIANYNEQIEASREARQQRRDELARLSKMRSNTKAQFNTQASVTRSY